MTVELSVENAIANMQTRMQTFCDQHLETMTGNIENNYYAGEEMFNGVLDGHVDPDDFRKHLKASYQDMMDTTYNFIEFIREAQYIFGETLHRHRDTLTRLFGLIYDIEHPYEAESPEVQNLMHVLRTDFQRELDKVSADKDAEIAKLSKDLGLWLLDDPHALLVSVQDRG